MAAFDSVCAVVARERLLDGRSDEAAWDLDGAVVLVFFLGAGGGLVDVAAFATLRIARVALGLEPDTSVLESIAWAKGVGEP